MSVHIILRSKAFTRHNDIFTYFVSGRNHQVNTAEHKGHPCDTKCNQSSPHTKNHTTTTLCKSQEHIASSRSFCITWSVSEMDVFYLDRTLLRPFCRRVIDNVMQRLLQISNPNEMNHSYHKCSTFEIYSYKYNIPGIYTSIIIFTTDT